MNIAILTFSRAFSYGALLQCYALSTILQKKGHTVKLLRSDLKGETDWRYYLNSYTRCANFRSFRRNYLPPRACKNEKFDLYIVGSDQVWNFHIPIKPLEYFFSFLPASAKRMSYAASFGMSGWTADEELTLQIKDCLSRFSSISVRESSGVSICKELFQCSAKEVLDPTLLLDDYFGLLNKNKQMVNKPVLFYYRVSEKNYWADSAYRIAEMLNLEIGLLPLKKRIPRLPFLRGLNAIHPSVMEWLRMIKESSFILTDSFHTVVFSILNRKEFIVLPSVESRMERVTSLLGKLGIEDRYFHSIDDVLLTDKWLIPIDYNLVYQKLDLLKNDSLIYIHENIE